MRVLRLDDPLPGRPSLDLHPYLTVVHGLSDSVRARFVDALASLAVGADPGVGGLVESHGLVLDLDRQTLDTLDLDPDLDVVVRPAHLPGNGSDGGPPSDEAAVERARLAMVEAERSYDTLGVAVEDLRRECDQAAGRAVRAGSSLGMVGSSDRTSPVQALDELLGRRAELAAGVAGLEAADRTSVESALRAAQTGDGPVPAHPDAIALADDLARAEGRLADLDRRLEADGLGPTAAGQRLEAALADVQRLEKAQRPLDHDPADVSELEAAHDRVREAEPRATGRLGGRRAQRRLEEALQREQTVLDRLGFPTYTAIVMSTTAPTVDHDERLRLEQARRAVVDAELAMEEAADEIERNPQRITLNRALEELRQRAAAMVGDVDHEQLVAALSGANPDDKVRPPTEAVAALRLALEGEGVELGDLGLSDSEVMDVAEVWLVEMDEAVAERSRLAAELVEVEEQLSSAASEPGFEAAIKQQRSLEDRLEAQEMLLDAAAGAAKAAAQRLELAERSCPDVPGDGDSAIADEAEWFLLARLAAQRAVSFAGSVPLVIDDALAGRRREDVTLLLEGLERMAESVQVVYLTDDGDVADWAAAGDPTRVGLILADQ